MTVSENENESRLFRTDLDEVRFAGRLTRVLLDYAELIKANESAGRPPRGKLAMQDALELIETMQTFLDALDEKHAPFGCSWHRSVTLSKERAHEIRDAVQSELYRNWFRYGF